MMPWGMKGQALFLLKRFGAFEWQEYAPMATLET
jgi:hypothetical protein